MNKTIQVAIVIVSDRVSAGVAQDASGPRLSSLINGAKLIKAHVAQTCVVPDDKQQIQSAVTSLCARCDLVLTCGGTGFAPRDVTPEAVDVLLERRAPGLVVAMLQGSLAITPLAMLSRPVAGVIGRCVVATLPGSPKAAEECLRLLAPGLPHAVDLLRQSMPAVDATHAALQAGTGTEHHGDVQTSEEGVQDQTGTVVPQRKAKGAVQTQKTGEERTSGAPPKHSGCCHGHGDGVQSTVDISQVSGRPRHSPYPAISMKEAEHIVAEEFSNSQLATETVNIRDALYRVAAKTIGAVTGLPPYRASVKDGYAVLSTDGAGVRRVLGVSNAGEEFASNDAATAALVTVTAGCCARVSTGAPLPPGADAVVMVEHTRLLEASEDGTREIVVEVLKSPSPGQDVRPAGSDFEPGAVVLTAGSRIGPLELAALVTAGVQEICVFRRPRVAVMSTGAEVQEPGTPLQEGRIFDTNRITLLSLLPETGADVSDAGIAPDRASELLNAIRTALSNADILVTTGGVSMGERDILKRVLEHDLNAKVHFGRVLMKPGLPTTFASLTLNGRRRWVFGLPGNPVSAGVCAVLHVVPALRAMSGLKNWQHTPLPVRLGHDWPLGSRPEYLRAKLKCSDGMLTAHVTQEDQRSSNVLSLCEADVLMMMPAMKGGRTHVKAGEQLQAIPINFQLRHG